MRTILCVAGLAAAALLAVTAVYAACFQMDRESTAFANAAVVAITSNWDADALLSRASPELTKISSAARVRVLFDRMDALGALANAQGCQNAATTVFFDARQGTIVRSAFNCAARYENSSATINIVLIKRGGTWKILGFHVNSPIFAAPTIRKA